MTTVAQGLFSYLTGGSPNPVAALIGTRCYPNILPQKPTLPAVTYTVIFGGRVVADDGPDGLVSTQFQIDCWAERYDPADALFKLVTERLQGFSGNFSGVTVQGIFLERERDSYDNTAKLYRRSGDFTIWNEGV